MMLRDKRRLAYTTALSGYFALLALLFAWIIWFRDTSLIPTSLLLLIAIGPLLFPLRGLLHGRPYTFAWASMLSLLYLIHSVVELYSSPDHRQLAGAELLFTLCFYGGAMFYARWRSQELKQLTPSPTAAIEDRADKGDGEASLGDQ